MSSENLKWLIGTLLAVASVVIGYLQYRRQVIAPTVANESTPEDVVTPTTASPQQSRSAQIVAKSEGQYDSNLRVAVAHKVARSIDISRDSPIFTSSYRQKKMISEDASWSIIPKEFNVRIGDCIWFCAEYTSAELLHFVRARLDFNSALKNIGGVLSLTPRIGLEARGLAFMERGTWKEVPSEQDKRLFGRISGTKEQCAKASWVPDVFSGTTIKHFNSSDRYRLHAIAWVSPSTGQRGRLVLESLPQEEVVHLLAEYAADL